MSISLYHLSGEFWGPRVLSRPFKGKEIHPALRLEDFCSVYPGKHDQ
jgi:hypothetical protein